MGKLTYFFIILAPGFAFNLVVWTLWKRLLRPRVKVIVVTIIVAATYWGIIDVVAIRWLGIWTFRSDHTSDFTAFGLLIEEWTLFLVSGGFVIPLLCVFLFKDKTRKTAGRTV